MTRIAAVLLLTAAVVLAAVASVGAVFGFGYVLGGQSAKATAQADKDKAQRAQRQAIDQAVAQARAEGDTATAALRDQLALASRFNATLDERRRHAKLTMPAPRCTAPAPTPATPSTAQAGQPPQQDAEVAAADPELTLAAVSLWNSALAGGDVPAGACRAAGTDDAACAAGSGLRIKHAWDNQAANAASCLADRQRASALIALLCKRPGQPGCTPTP